MMNKTNNTESNLIRHAWNEFKALGWCNDDREFTDEMQKDICKGIIELLTVFSEQGHSGSTAPYAIRLFEKLASFEPIAPLTGAESEWNEIQTGEYQNNRCSRVFKSADRFGGQAYDIEAVVFYDELVDDEGLPYRSHFTSGGSARPIEFPYTPKTEYQPRPGGMA